jgi:hypothetical protein
MRTLASCIRGSVDGFYEPRLLSVRQFGSGNVLLTYGALS